MRAVVIFLLSLFVLLLNGQEYTQSETHIFSSFSAVHKIGQTHYIKNHNHSGKKGERLDVEIPDDDVVSVRKYVLSAQYFLTAMYGVFLFCFAHFLKERLPSSVHFSLIFSHRYLLQRVLRL